MTTRELPREEWGKITEADGGREILAAAAPHTQIKVVVVEDEAGRVVGSWLVYPAVHVEGLWIAPDHRKRASVLGRLLSGMRRAADGFGVTQVLTQSLAPEVDDLLSSYGATMVPGRSWALPTKRET